MLTFAARLALPLLALAPLLGLARYLFDRRALAGIGFTTRLLAALVLVGSVGFLAWLHIWHLLGWHL